MKKIMKKIVLQQMMIKKKKNKTGKKIYISSFKKIKEQKHIDKEIECKFNNQEQVDLWVKI